MRRNTTTLKLALMGIAPEWQMKRELLSPAYTTRRADIPAAKLA
ncbi:DUF4113 domain-containing protein [Escherichia coli]|nr:DUF4113 domain-containing protein [Escherichia coli]